MKIVKYLFMGLFLVLFLAGCSLLDSGEVQEETTIKVLNWKQEANTVSFDYVVIGDVEELVFVFYSNDEVVKQDEVKLITNSSKYEVTLNYAGGFTYNLKIGDLVSVENGVLMLDLLYEKSFTLSIGLPVITYNGFLNFRVGYFNKDSFLEYLIENVVITDVIAGDVLLTESMVDFTNVSFSKEGSYKAKITYENSFLVKTEKILDFNFVLDTKAPVVQMINNLVLEAGDTVDDILEFFSVTDDFDEIKLTVDNFDVSGVNFNREGQYILKITVSDESLNTTTVSFSITIVGVYDIVKPAISNIKDLVFEVNEALPNLDEYFLIEDESEILSVNYSVIDITKLGEVELKVTASDIYNNIEEKTFVLRIVDTTAPVVSITQELKLDAGGTFNDILGYFKVVDNYDTLSLTIENFDFSKVNFNKEGQYAIKVVIMDSNHNITEQSFTISIIGTYDVVGPTITNIKELVFEVNTVLPSLNEYFLVEDENEILEVTFSDTINMNLIGEYPLTVTASDIYNNIEEKSFIVKVKDTTSPVITLISDIVVYVNGTIDNIMNFISVSDNYYEITLTVENLDISLVDFTKEGTYIVGVSVTDGSQNMTNETFSVIVSGHPDDASPVITNIKDLIFEVNTILSDLLSYFDIVDDSEISSIVFSETINIKVLGEYELTVSAYDIYGNLGEETFNVQVVDTTAPVITVLDTIDINLGDPIGDLTKYVIVTDNYNQINITMDNFDVTEVDVTRAGEYPIYITVMDLSGNVSYLTINITIHEDYYEEVVSTEIINKLWAYEMPSTGDVNVLVIPIAFPGYSSTETMRSNIQKGFFGTESDTGWESLKSYYHESSYGALNIMGTVTSWYTPNNTQSYYASYSDSSNYIYGSTVLLYEALTYYKSTYDYSNFDSDNDGYIDAVYLIYNCPIGGNGSSAQEDFYWAFVYWDYSRERNYNGMDAYSYMFAGYDFFFEEMRGGNNVTLNAETFIHETGHLLGLEDYYDYDEGKGVDGGYGGADMMDWNIGDHNPFSKALLGWINPLVVKRSGIIELNSFTDTGMFLLVPVGNYNGLFNEYFVIDFFTLTGLNGFGMGNFLNVRNNDIALGVRISHVNAKITREDYGYEFTYSSQNATAIYKLIRWLEADYNDSKFDCDSNSKTVEYDDFFTPTSKQFGYDNFKNYKTYSNQILPFKMKVLSMTDTSVKIEITLN